MDKDGIPELRAVLCNHCVFCTCVILAREGRPQSKASEHKEVFLTTDCIDRSEVWPMLRSMPNHMEWSSGCAQFLLLREHHRGNILDIIASLITVCTVSIDVWAMVSF